MGYILVIDDDKSICSLIQAFLAKMGYEVEVAHDGKAGIECFDNGPDFDLVITDIRMPKMNGSDVARHIRGSDRPSTPIVAITGFSDTDISIGFFDSLLTKPFDLDALKDIVTSLTGNS
jgi:CheY-like chemotaxis protein